jgi:hypothetical protein
MLSSNLAQNAECPCAGGLAVATPCSWGRPLPPLLLSEPFDVVVGADVAYVHHTLSPLLVTVLQLMLPNERATLVLAQPTHRGVSIQELRDTFNPHICFEEPCLISEELDEKVHILVGRMRSREETQGWLHGWLERGGDLHGTMEFDTHDQMLEAALGTPSRPSEGERVPFGPDPRPELSSST